MKNSTIKMIILCVSASLALNTIAEVKVNKPSDVIIGPRKLHVFRLKDKAKSRPPLNKLIRFVPKKHVFKPKGLVFRAQLNTFTAQLEGHSSQLSALAGQLNDKKPCVTSYGERVLWGLPLLDGCGVVYKEKLDTPRESYSAKTKREFQDAAKRLRPSNSQL